MLWRDVHGTGDSTTSRPESPHGLVPTEVAEADARFWVRKKVAGDFTVAANRAVDRGDLVTEPLKPLLHRHWLRRRAMEASV